MVKLKVKYLMVPLSQYATVLEDATLGEAIKALQTAQEEFDQTRDKHRAILVSDKNNRIVGKLSQLDVIRSLEPKYMKFDDRKSLSRWLWAQDRYMSIEAEMINESSWSELGLTDKVRKLILIAPVVIFFYCLVLKGGLLDGWAGLYYAFQRMVAELILSIKLIEKKIKML